MLIRMPGSVAVYSFSPIVPVKRALVPDPVISRLTHWGKFCAPFASPAE